MLNCYFMLLLCLWKDRFNLSLLYSQDYILLLLWLLNIITDNDVNKQWFITDLLRWKNICKGLHIHPVGLYYGTCIQAVREASNVLGHLYPEAALSQQPDLISKKKAKVAIKLIETFMIRRETLASYLLMSPRVKETGIPWRISM